MLGKLNDPNWAKPYLTKKLSDPHELVRKNAALALMKLNAKDAKNDLHNLYLTEKKPEVINVLKLAISQLSKEN
mgnify:CR=1 FL=1